MKKILLVEDDQRVCKNLVLLLESQYEIVVAFNGEDALKMFLSMDIDLVITDIKMPKMNGYLLTKAIRQSDSSTPILIINDVENDLEELQAFQVGASDYILKTRHEKILLYRIKSLLDRENHTEKVLQVGDLVLDISKCEVRYLNQSYTDLTRIELKLLQYLMNNESTAKSREEIVYDVWEDKKVRDIRIIDAHIKNIRKKVKGIKIESISGVGYRLIK